VPVNLPACYAWPSAKEPTRHQGDSRLSCSFHIMIRHSAFLFVVLLSSACLAFAGQDAVTPRINILIIDGEAPVKFAGRPASEIVIEVEDENHRPITGAVVVFMLPDGGPGGTFLDGSRSATATTDAQGRAPLPHVQPNRVAGKFQIRLNASYQGRQATARISQSNPPRR
jgi:hypothetical protein